MLKKILKIAQKDLYVQAVSVFAILLSITVVAVAYIKTTGNEEENNVNTSYNYETLPPQAPLSTNSVIVNPVDTSVPLSTDIGWQNTPSTQPQPQQQGANPQGGSSAYSWTKSQIIANMTTAINKTKGYTGNLAVTHREDFVANITDCTGGSVGKTVANKLVEAVVKPTAQTLKFSNGKATTSEGEVTQLLLPKNGPFSLPEAGVASAKAYPEGTNTVIVVTLVKENCDQKTIPQYNSKSIGYLDVNSVDLMGMTINKGEIQYIGSTIMIKINQAGYVTYAKYSIPLHVYGEGSKGSLSGHATFDGEQTEIWEIPL